MGVSIVGGGGSGAAQTQPPFSPVPHASGLYYTSPIAVNTSTVVTTQSRNIAIPFWAPSTGTYDRIAGDVTAAAASSTVRLGIYADTGNGYPGALILDAGTIDGNSATFQAITISQSLTGGVLYWLTAVAQGGTPTVRNFNNGPPILAMNGAASTGVTCGFFENSVTGALPATFTASIGYNTNALRVMLRRA